MNMPAGWRTLTPHELGGGDKTRLVIGPFGSNLKTTDYRSEGVPLVFVRDIRSGSFREPQQFVSPEKAAELRSHVALPGDVLITKMGEPPGDAAVYTGSVPAIITADCIRLRPIEEFDPRYVSYAMQFPSVKHQVELITSGIAQRKVSLSRFRSGVSIPVPPLAEQRRIVDLLDDQLSRLDSAEGGLRTALARCEALLTSRIWYATHGIAGATPRELQSIAEVRLGRQRSPKNHAGDRMRPYLRAANVGWDTLRLDDVKQMQFSEAEEKTYRLEAGDILLTEASGSAAEVGKSVLYRGERTNICFQNTLLRVRCHSADAEFIQKYLLAEARAGQFMPESRGVGINHLGRARLASLYIALPAPDVQASAVAVIREVVDEVDRLKIAIRDQQRQAAALRRSMLASAFSGRLTTSPRRSHVEEPMSA